MNREDTKGVREGQKSLGKVYLVGGGPGDPGLMTLKGKGLLECADVVVYDALISPAILAMINPQAEKIDAGKRKGRHSLLQEETTQLLIDKARDHAIERWRSFYIWSRWRGDGRIAAGWDISGDCTRYYIWYCGSCLRWHSFNASPV
jgi:Tetrapyrrole (Corrin/Porphyrin) Methylases